MSFKFLLGLQLRSTIMDASKLTSSCKADSFGHDVTLRDYCTANRLWHDQNQTQLLLNSQGDQIPHQLTQPTSGSQCNIDHTILSL